ncbi:RHS repeat protein [Fusibacter bizertensis]|uniref:RHS repeat protein n=1 Tax=Fusibacter bizertensis TaxID=1488331 RepID=A0ABT6NF03_9FIRM|nr:RHS repeat domain-containing protein [Fusibacter bizertensis]MDH8679008.1 RHS repeat protein [Fusibacter bizertensis]
MIDPSGTIQYIYENGRVSEIINRLDRSTQYDYNEAGNPAKTTFGDGTYET